MTQKKRKNLGRGLAALFGEEASQIAATLDAPPAPPAADASVEGSEGAVDEAIFGQTGHSSDGTQGETPAAAPAAPAPTTGGPGMGRPLPLEKLAPNPFQPRRRFAEEEIEELAQSIRENGILQPILVRPHPSQPGEYQIVAGERRWRAAQRARLHEVPVVLRQLDDAKALEIAVLENIQRQDLTPLEEAEGYQRLLEEFGHTQQQLSEALGKSRSHIANALRLLKLPDAVKAMLDEGKLTAGHARALVGQAEAEAMAKEIVRYDMSVRQTEAMVGKRTRKDDAGTAGTKSAPPAAAAGKDADTLELERSLSERLGLAVTIEPAKGNPEQGRVTVAYQDLEQLDEIMRVLNAGAA